MLKNKMFYILLIVIYLLFLSRDFILSNTNFNDLKTSTNNITNNYYYEEYLKLNELLDIDSSKLNIVYTKTLIRNIYDFYNKIEIKKGTNDHFMKGNIVLNSKGVVGIINKTNTSTSEVYLLTNPNINISVKVNDAYGILTSKDNIIYVKNIKLTHNINIGDKVYTSGLTNIPGNLIIGEVTNKYPDKLGLEYILEITSSANLDDLKYLGVVL